MMVADWGRWQISYQIYSQFKKREIFFCIHIIIERTMVQDSREGREAPRSASCIKKVIMALYYAKI